MGPVSTAAISAQTLAEGMVGIALSQLGNRLGVPVHSGGGQITAANTPEGQAMMDSTNAMWATLLSGAHQVWHAAGWLEGGLTMSFEKFITDVDNCGAMLRMCNGMVVDEESLSKESYLETGPAHNFLSTPHTLRHFATANYESLLPDTGPDEAWKENGSLSAEQPANTVYKSMLERYTQPALDTSRMDALESFVAQRKSAMRDEWY